MQANRKADKFPPSYLLECFSYDPDSGSLVWLRRPRNHFKSDTHQKLFNRSHEGKPAGRPLPEGYISIRINRNDALLAHRIAWVVYYGFWPSNQIDHKNGERADNRICNLREATHAENCRNIGITKKTSHGVVGVTWAPHAQKWQAKIKFNRKRIHLGYFSEFSRAVEARRSAEIQYHGEFAASNRANHLTM